MAKNGITTAYDDAGYPAVAASTAAIAAGAGVVTVKASPGRLAKVVVTTAASTGVLTVYDNATTNSGTVLAVVPASTTAGTIFDIQAPCVNGITVNAAASSAAVTLSYS